MSLKIAIFYCIFVRLQEELSEHPPRLFQCSNASGRFLMTEVGEFSQVKTLCNKVRECIMLYSRSFTMVNVLLHLF